MEPENSAKQTLRITAVGDIALNGVYRRRKFADRVPWDTVEELFAADRLRIGNLESPISNAARCANTKFTLRANASAIQVLERTGFGVLNLANNHAMDFGSEGLLETVSTVKQRGINVVGAGDNFDSAQQVLQITHQDQQVSIISFCDVEQISPLYAARNQPGVSGLDEKSVSLVRKLREEQEGWLIVILHWGTELSCLPAPAQRELAREMVNAGADAIIGHHPHVLQPMEIIDGVPVWYSLGNFAFSSEYWRGTNASGEAFVSEYRLHPLARIGGVAQMTLSRSESCRTRLITTKILGDGRVVPCHEAQHLENWQRLCELLTADHFESEFVAESQRACERRTWQIRATSLVRRLQLKAFQFGLIGCN